MPEDTTTGATGAIVGKLKEKAGELLDRSDLQREGELQQRQSEAELTARRKDAEARAAQERAELDEERARTRAEAGALRAAEIEDAADRSANAAHTQQTAAAARERAREEHRADAERASAERAESAADAIDPDTEA